MSTMSPKDAWELFIQILNKIKTRCVNLIVCYPIAVIVATLLASFFSCIICSRFESLPALNNPDKGFSARGTSLSDKRLAKLKLDLMVKKRELYLLRDLLGNNIDQSTVFSFDNGLSLKDGSLEMHDVEDSKENVFTDVEPDEMFNDFEDDTRRSSRLLDMSDMIHHDAMYPTFIACNDPTLSDDCAQIVIESKDPVEHSLMSMDFLELQCEYIEKTLMAYFLKLLPIDQYQLKFESLVGTITKFAGKSNCNQLDSQDLTNFTATFRGCARLYARLDVAQTATPLPQFEDLQRHPVCLDQHLVDAYKYLVDRSLSFHDSKSSRQLVAAVRYTSIYISVHRRDWRFLLPFYRACFASAPASSLLQIRSQAPSSSRYFISGLNFDIRIEEFEVEMKSSLSYLAFAAIIIFCVSLLYLRNLSLTLTLLLCTTLSMFEGYYAYKLILRIDFFPVINILVAFLLLGMAANAYVTLSATWHDALLKYEYILKPDPPLNFSTLRRDSNESFAVQSYQSGMRDLYLKKCVMHIMRHGGGPIFLTNGCVVAALLANTVSHIAVVRLTSLYAALVVTIQFNFIMLLVPSVLVMSTKRPVSLIKHLQPIADRIKGMTRSTQSQVEWTRTIFREVYLGYKCLFDTWLPNFILRFRFYLGAAMLIIGLLGLLFSAYLPGFKLPDSDVIRFFSADNPLEHYESQLAFSSASSGVFFYQQVNKPRIRVSYIVGVISTDTGSVLEPDDMGAFQLDTTNFNFYEESSQTWLAQFCTWLGDTTPLDIPRHFCLADVLRDAFTQDCRGTDFVGRVCCGQTSWPVDGKLLERCMLNETFLMRYVAPHEPLLRETLYFDRASGLVCAVEFQQTTQYALSTDYSRMATHYTQIDTAFQQQLHLVADLQLAASAFFVADFDLYDTQKALRDGSLQAGLIALLATALLFLIMTRDLLVTIYAIVTIALTQCASVGFLAVLGWKLGAIEASTLIFTAGVSTSSLAHLAVAYACSSTTDQPVLNETSSQVAPVSRGSLMKQSVRNAGATVLVGALMYTLVAVVMFPSALATFSLYATFILVTVMFALLFTFFLFLPICAIMGNTSHLYEVELDTPEIKQRNRLKDESAVTTTVLSVQPITIMQKLDLDKSIVSNKKMDVSIYVTNF